MGNTTREENIKYKTKNGSPVCIKEMRKNWDLYLLILPVVVYFIIFKYLPMFGVQIAFRDYISTRGSGEVPL